ncbi:MAG: hypothetical protein GWN13_02930 [Phycisphaerae bacterium]|nr:hypothetical protein [Phycisphaerae bacterium]
MERRKLVGRRYEDYLLNNIVLELSPEERAWRMAISDPRYNPLLERRSGPRRKQDRPISRFFSLFRAECNFLFMETPFKVEDM